MSRLATLLAVLAVVHDARAQENEAIVIEVAYEEPDDTALVEAVDRAAGRGGLRGSDLGRAIDERISGRRVGSGSRAKRREDAREAEVAETAQENFERADSASDTGTLAVPLMTTGTSLVLGGIAALAVPASDRSTTFHGPVFWVLSAAALVASGLGVGLLLLDGCGYDDHPFCPRFRRLGGARGRSDARPAMTVIERTTVLSIRG